MCVYIARAQKNEEDIVAFEETFSFLTALLMNFSLLFFPQTKEDLKGSLSTITITTTPFILSRITLSL